MMTPFLSVTGGDQENTTSLSPATAVKEPEREIVFSNNHRVLSDFSGNRQLCTYKTLYSWK